ncbi:hypothetical protein Pla86_51210 [Planctomycetes bacterium Pla86]|uniref:Uncharacterized protein n=2 Tax=Engelhardtia mirabilis TaxID=2528011 RepID=A0A518BSQ1_9BACT|nr:hypothetical protein Pla133_51240 [Planctomycetes bacterium Pla133]QDV04326.1 hypothetical protein Pla86_51210 [Planctomycetes bacterium Pla86]
MALGHRLAVAAGAACGLLSLLWDAPAETAALRGVLAWVAVLAHFRLSAKALGWRLRQEAAEERAANEAAAAEGN